MVLAMSPAATFAAPHVHNKNSYNYGNKYSDNGKKYGKHNFGKHKYPKVHKTNFPKLHKVHYPKLHKVHYPKIHKIHFPKFHPKFPHKAYCPPKGPKGPKGGGGHHGFGNTVVWTVIACAGTTVTAALAANYTHHRELTAEEAQSCGILYFFSGH
jgi:hypothetical protein